MLSWLSVLMASLQPKEKKLRKAASKSSMPTCPKVGYVQAIIKKHAALDYTVVIVGDKGTSGSWRLLGYAGRRGITLATWMIG